MPDHLPLVSIIIISFNTKKLIQDCLESVIPYTNNTAEIIVVDNGSTDGSLKYLRKQNDHGTIRLIELPQNIGFGPANNRGAAIAKGKYLLFLNSDTLFTQDVISPAVRFATTYPKLGALSCALKYSSGKTQVSGGAFPTLWRLFAWQFFIDDLPLVNRLFKSIHPHTPPHSLSFPDWITGAFMFIPRSVFSKSGGFDENIFLYTEELELCFRINKLGFVVAYDPKTSITHLSGGSGGSKLAIINETKNMQYFFEKHTSRLEANISKIILRAGCLLRFTLFGIIRNNAVSRDAYLTAFRSLS